MPLIPVAGRWALLDSVLHGGTLSNMVDQKRTARPLRMSDDEAAPVIAIADRETEGNFSMAVRKLLVEALEMRAKERKAL